MKRLYYLSIFFVLLILFINPARTEYIPLSATKAEALQQKLYELVQANNMIGASYALITPKDEIWSGASGLADIEQNKPLTKDMLFGFGSCTKTFVSALFMQYIDEGKVELTDTIGTWIKGYKNINGQVTIKQLLNHTSGLFNYSDDPALGYKIIEDFRNNIEPEFVLSNYIKEPYFQPGQGFHYSNTNYLLLGLIAEKLTSGSIKTELQSRLLTKANMHNTFFGDSAFFSNPEICGENPKYTFPVLYVRISANDSTPYPLIIDPRDYIGIFSCAWAAGAMVSTTEDMAIWADNLYTSKLFSQERLKEMTDFTAQSGNFYGLGCMNFQSGVRMWGHNGDINYFSFIGYLPDDSMSFSIVTHDAGNKSRLINILNEMLVLSFNIIEGTDEETENEIVRVGEIMPNPATDFTTIRVNMFNAGNLNIRIFDMGCREVKTICNELSSGPSDLKINISDLPTGSYLLLIESGKYKKAFVLNVLR